jgi:hypothetical protein
VRLITSSRLAFSPKKNTTYPAGYEKKEITGQHWLVGSKGLMGQQVEGSKNIKPELNNNWAAHDPAVQRWQRSSEA